MKLAGVPTIAIVGGGVSGALTAFHLLRQPAAPCVVIIDPGPRLGLGLAHSTPSPRHLLNVPAGKISALPDQPDHFLNWLRAHHDTAATPGTFAPRFLFGNYVSSLLESSPGLQAIRGSVLECRPYGAGHRLALDNGQLLDADFVILALGNFHPAPPSGLDPAAEASGLYSPHAWHPRATEAMAPEATVALIGSGLTAVDALLRLREIGHRGTVVAISRHGLLPAAHAPTNPLPESAIAAGTQPTCATYTRVLRQAIRDGAPWRAAVDSLRPHSNTLWQRLPAAEQRRFRRHLQRRWDIARHRMAPEADAAIQDELAAGTLLLRRGRVIAIELEQNGQALHLTLRTVSGQEKLAAARVIHCTSPNIDYRRVPSPLLHDLFHQGLATTGALGFGFASTPEGALIGPDGMPSSTLFTLGPSRIGTLFESTAVPEIRAQAASLAELLGERIAAHAC
ncbi:FAD/NAD(P)-binding protein [Silvibacterium sp.]|uniref:FAD/NAD(P)-binding protein n=1 Tax=Silvibacterium sp. TaxID=1964179 RepID=UPI0039E5C6B7